VKILRKGQFALGLVTGLALFAAAVVTGAPVLAEDEAADAVAVAVAVAEPTAQPEAGPTPEPEAVPEDAAPAAAVADDVPAAIPFKTGDKISFKELSKIENYIPAPFWENRDYIFFEGMNLEIGEFFKDYPVSEQRIAATEKFGGQAKIGADGSLLNFTMGQPFPDIAADDPEAGVKHAWNFHYKHDALEGRASFYFTYWDSGEQLPLNFQGKAWGLRLANRPDHMDRGGDIFNDEKRMGAGGIRIDNPPDYRGILALGYAYKAADRPRETARDVDVWVYIPDLRRVRRISGSTRTDPVAGTDMIGEDQGGFAGLVTHFDWELIGEQDVLAPIDTRLRGYPFTEEEDFGPFGFSTANDVYQLRKAIIIEMRPKERHPYKRKRMWLDKETYQPLYVAAWDKRDELWKLIHLAHRWSERTDYKDKVKGVFTFLPNVFFVVNVVTATGVRVEFFDAHATRMSRGKIRKQIDLGRLSREGR